MTKLKKLLRDTRGEGFVDIFVIVIVFMLMLVLFINVATVFVKKQQLDMYAGELCRVAELYGRIGTETTARAAELTSKTGLTPAITWSKSGKLALGENFTLTLKITQDIGFGSFGSVPIPLTSRNGGQGEVYWKS